MTYQFEALPAYLASSICDLFIESMYTRYAFLFHRIDLFVCLVGLDLLFSMHLRAAFIPEDCTVFCQSSYHEQFLTQ